MLLAVKNLAKNCGCFFNCQSFDLHLDFWICFYEI